eukprot:2030430-Prymnesium_polylepis.1
MVPRSHDWVKDQSYLCDGGESTTTRGGEEGGSIVAKEGGGCEGRRDAWASGWGATRDGMAEAVWVKALPHSDLSA